MIFVVMSVLQFKVSSQRFKWEMRQISLSKLFAPCIVIRNVEKPVNERQD